MSALYATLLYAIITVSLAVAAARSYRSVCGLEWPQGCLAMHDCMASYVALAYAILYISISPTHSSTT